MYTRSGIIEMVFVPVNTTIAPPVPMQIDITKPIILCSITMFFAVIGNLFLLYIILQRCKHGVHKISPVQVLIVHACIGDLLFAFLTLLPQIIKTITFPNFYGGVLVCKLHMYTSMIPLWASPFMLIAISVDRYLAICKPLTALRHRKIWRAQVYAGTAWCMSFIFALPQLVIFVYEVREGVGICTDIFNDYQTYGKIYMLYFSTFAWLIPSIVAGFMYTNICYIVWRSLSDAGHIITTPELRGGRERASFDASSMNYVSRLRIKDSRVFQAECMEHQKIKTVKLTLTIIILNFTLWAPFCISNVVKIFSPGSESDMITPYIMMLGNLNSCVNPWIYVVFNMNQVKAVFCGTEPAVNTFKAYQLTKVAKYGSMNSDPLAIRNNRRTEDNKVNLLTVTETNSYRRRSSTLGMKVLLLAEIQEVPETNEELVEEVEASGHIRIGRGRYRMGQDKSEFSFTKDSDSTEETNNHHITHV